MIPDLTFHWKLFIRRLPVMMVLVLFFSGLGIITALKLPETWSTSARMLLEGPQIPESMISAGSGTADTELLDIIQERLLTRANLIDIANRYNVFADMAQMAPDDVLSQMRAATIIRRNAGRNRATVMSITFEARSGQIAANVVNEFVTLVLAENSNSRRERVQSALGFFEQEVARLGQQLDAQSGRIAEFKAENADALPGDQRFRLDRLTRLQERASQIIQEQRTIETQRVEVQRIYDNTGQVEPADTRQRTVEEERLFVARNQLDDALSLYSETHPQVVRLKSQIARLEAQVAAQTQSAPDEAGTDAAAPSSPQDLIFQSTLADLDARMLLLTDDAERIEGEMTGLREAISQSASNEIALAALDRDFENLQRRYNAALNNLNTTQVNERIETAAQGQRITTIENATIPQNPTGPNRKLIASAGGAVGLGLAAAYFILLELLNRSIRRPEEMVQKFNVTPICVVPYLESRTQRYTRRAFRVTAVLGVLTGVPLALWYVDTNYLPLDLLVQQGLARLGLS